MKRKSFEEIYYWYKPKRDKLRDWLYYFLALALIIAPFVIAFKYLEYLWWLGVIIGLCIAWAVRVLKDKHVEDTINEEREFAALEEAKKKNDDPPIEDDDTGHVTWVDAEEF